VEDMAEKVETSINEGAAAQAGDQRRGRVPSITVTPDRRSNTLMVSGDPALFDGAEKLARAMEKLGPQSGKTMQIVRLKNTSADDFIRVIEQLKGEQGGAKKPTRARSSNTRSPRRSSGGATRGNTRRR